MSDPILIEVPEKIETERLLIAAPRAGVGPALNEAVIETMDQLKRWMPWAQQASTIEEMEAVVRRQVAAFVLREDLPFQIYSREPQGRRLLGAMGLHRFDWAARRFEIGYWLRRTAQGQGLMSEAVNGMAEMAFTQLRARRLEIRCDETNDRSRGVAERCGFTLESVMRGQSVNTAGELCSSCVYVKFKPD
ncbi:GNAT family N-acetyltransferase [Pelomonas sp. SE-A7]|uniref:GNAT family N-acetyltransferase n=1 Tax=Pelomonas sp. SE-A7 TaxID=3054953 RepID=UPI00259CF863|nr:GNAT family N-acetyltransferase [Pelomonas sp. SE-A7]MDM4767464.1 GNAT family N-acetyltransferase [Pelomonas sp. SE-A7]